MSNGTHIEVDLGRQRLSLYEGDRCIRVYRVSTARKGVGERQDSLCTPRGAHVVAEKIGAGCAPNTVFVARQPTGELYTVALRDQQPGRDWILTRIIWLRGAEPGRNQGGEVDSYARYIYIHGSPDDVPMGVPGSRGCVRMRNADVIELFDRVEVGTAVIIKE